MTTHGPDLCFVSATRGSIFMEELLEVVADAVRRAGYRARTTVGPFPDPDDDTVYVVVPHEYFAAPEGRWVSREQRLRTIGFCVEHPGTSTFEYNASLLPDLGGAVDINRDSSAELRRRGIPVEPFQLGYSPLWDRWGGDPHSVRDVDVTYLGTAERRRAQLLASYWRDLEDLQVRMLTPPHEPMGPQRVDFLPGEAKHAHLAGSRFLLNLHRERSRALEWVRVLEALCNGCVVLTEPSTDIAPLVPGTHLVVTGPAMLGAAAAGLAQNPTRESELRQAGYEYVRDALDLAGSAHNLGELATALRDAHPAVPAPVAVPDSSDDQPRPLAVDTPSWDVRFAGTRSLDSVSVSSRTAPRLVQETEDRRHRAQTQWFPARTTALFAESRRAEVDVLLVCGPGEPDPDPLIRDLLSGTVLPNRVLLGEDGSGPGAARACADVLWHEFPLGRGLTRNRLRTCSEAPWLLVLDGGMRASRRLLERLLTAAEHTAEAEVAHCPVGDPVHGLVGALPPESRRLANVPYLGSGYLVRTDVLDMLGGWSEDAMLDGLEDHVFWQRIAQQNHATVLVQQVLLHRDRPDPPPRPVDTDPHHLWSRLNSPEHDPPSHPHAGLPGMSS